MCKTKQQFSTGNSNEFSYESHLTYFYRPIVAHHNIKSSNRCDLTSVVLFLYSSPSLLHQRENPDLPNREWGYKDFIGTPLSLKTRCDTNWRHPSCFCKFLAPSDFSGALVGAKVTPALAIGMFQLLISTNFMPMDNPLGNFIVNIWAITPDCFYACPVKRVRLFDTGRKEANPPKLSVSGGAAKVVPLGAGEHTACLQYLSSTGKHAVLFQVKSSSPLGTTQALSLAF